MKDSLGVVVIFLAFIGVIIYASKGESYYHPIPKTVTITIPYSP